MRSDKGFTLVELLVYASLFTIVAGLLTAVLTNVTRVNNKQIGGTEVAQQLNFVLNTVQNLVNESSLIEAVYEGSDSGSTCSQFCTLKLRMASSTLDPTLVSSDASGVYLKQGTNATNTLTSDAIRVDKFNLTKFEFDGGHASVRLDMAFTYNADNLQLAVTRSLQSAFGRASAAVFDDHILPGTDNSYDVGQVSGSKRWRDAAFADDVTIEGSLGVGTTAPNASALLDLTSTTLGFLPPRMTSAQRDAVSAPVNGLIVYNTDDSALNFYDGSSWNSVGGTNWTATSTHIYNANAGNVGIGTTTPGYKLDVVGGLRVSATSSFSAFSSIVTQSCPSGWWSAAYGRLCMEQTERGPGTIYNAIAACQALGNGARVCEHNDFQQICGTGVDPYTNASGHYGDHAVASGGNWDDEFGSWNSASCSTNNDGPGQHSTFSAYYHCCF